MIQLQQFITALALGIIIGCLITKKVTQRQLYMAYSRGTKKTRMEHVQLIEHLNRRIARIEMQNRRFNLTSIDGGKIS